MCVRGGVDICGYTGREDTMRTTAITRIKAKEETHLPLAREIAVTRRDAKEERVELGQLFRRDDRVRRLGWRVHLREDVFGQRLGDPGQR